MTNWEIIKECKQSYELLNDLCDNSQIATSIDRNNIERCMGVLENMYTRAWDMLSEDKDNYKLLITNIKCPRCGEQLCISDLIGYAYLCENCDENMYLSECEVENVWWNND